MASIVAASPACCVAAQRARAASAANDAGSAKVQMTKKFIGTAPARLASARKESSLSAFRPTVCGIFDMPATEIPKLPMWPDEDFIAETLAAFPDKAVANEEEARVLLSEGDYTYLDVRSVAEVEKDGPAPKEGVKSVHIPFKNATYRWDSETKSKKLQESDNPDFMKKVQSVFRSKEAKIIVSDSTGREHATDALMALDDEGYTNIVGLKGGYRKWATTWDSKLRRRIKGDYNTVYNADGDSMGIHTTGAGAGAWSKSDTVDAW
eukprot:jgi/Mesvir1/18918/Mv18905-RA.1